MSADHIERIRAFNRFYTQQIGLIRRRFLESRFSLVQARVLFELHAHPRCFARDLGQGLGLDPAYLSKILKKFEQEGLLTRACSPTDSRKYMLTLTPDGEAAYEELRERSDRQIDALVRDLPGEERDRLVASMESIERILTPEKRGAEHYLLRSHRPGDIGYIIHRHGVLYAREYGFNERFDAYVADGMGRFIEGMDPEREHLWIAEANGTVVGSVAIVRSGEDASQLRWLFVEPSERRKGIAKRLVEEAVNFSRRCRYPRIMLWTIDFLHAARKIYADAGFRPVEEKTSRAWGRELNEEKWELSLG